VDESRRDLIKKAAVGTGIVWAAPIIHTGVAYAAGTPEPTTSTSEPPPGCSFDDRPIDATQEVPPNASPGTGTAVVTFDATTLQLCISATFQNLTTNAIAAHIHGPAAPGVNAPILFNLTGFPNATSGTIPLQCFTLTAAQRDELCGSLYYINIHTQSFPGGEIRGQLVPAVVVP
jgi:hypothetical protein